MAWRGLLLGFLLVAPLVCGTCVLTWITVVEASGSSAFERGLPLNSAEAAAFGAPADSLRFMMAGEDPGREYPLRPWVISSEYRRATMMEAAMWSRRIEMIRLFDRAGAISSEVERQELACLASDLGMPDVSSYLAPGGAGCVPGTAQERVRQRTRSTSE